MPEREVAARFEYEFKKRGASGASFDTIALFGPKSSLPHGEPGEELLVEIYYRRELKWNRVMAPAHVVKDVFWDPPRRRQTPPADF